MPSKRTVIYCPVCNAELHSNANAFYCSNCRKTWRVRSHKKAGVDSD